MGYKKNLISTSAPYSQSGVNTIDSIRNSRNRKAFAKVLAPFSGPPKKGDLTHVKLRETGWAMAQRVFHP